MGHQVNFFALPADVAEFEKSLKAVEPFLILHSRSQAKTPKVVESMLTQTDLHPWLYYCLVRSTDLESVVMAEVPAQGYWTVDVTRSPVVEFHCSFFNGEVLRRGRAYYVASFFGADGEKVEKPDEFKKWAKQILSTIRKRLVKRNGDYISERAGAWLTTSRSNRLDEY